MKILRDADHPSYGVLPARKPAPNSREKERNIPAGVYAIKDRVTISSTARELSGKFAPPVTDLSADSIFSYEIRAPLAGPVLKKN